MAVEVSFDGHAYTIEEWWMLSKNVTFKCVAVITTIYIIRMKTTENVVNFLRMNRPS